MKPSRRVIAAIAASLLVVPAAYAAGPHPGPAPAPHHGGSSAGAAIGGFLAGVMTGVIVDEASKPKPPAPQIVQYSRAQLRDIQRRLNILGFNAGTPDGIMGGRTRSAMRAFQQSLHHPVNGFLTDQELDTLYNQSDPYIHAKTDAPVTPAPKHTATTASATSDDDQEAADVEDIAPHIATDEELKDANLETEIAKTPYKNQGDQPKIVGVTLGDTSGAVKAKLDAAGFADCKSSMANAWKCSRDTDTLADRIGVWSAPDQGVWAIVRSVTFTEPVSTDFITEHYGKAYPELSAQTDGVIASADSCDLSEQDANTLAAEMDKIAAPDAAGQKAASDLHQLALRCPLAYAITAKPDGDKIAAINLIFFNGTEVLAHDRAVAAMPTEHEKSVSSDLVM